MPRTFRHPQTQNERRADASLAQDNPDAPIPVKARRRGMKKDGLPTERDDLAPAATQDRSRGKPTHSIKRKAKERARDSLLK